MSFKNAFKILVSKFGLVWLLMLFFLCVGVIVAGLSAPFLTVMIRAIRTSGINEQIAVTYQGILDGNALSVTADEITEIIESIKELFRSDKGFSVSSSVLVFVVLIFAYRFLVGLYELPMVSVTEGLMSSNARFGFFRRFVALLGRSCRFVLVKMIYTVIFDAAIFFTLTSMLGLFDIKGSVFFAPFLIMLVLVLFLTVRYSLIAMWAPSMVADGKNVFEAFAFSVKKCVKHIKPIFSSFALSWLVIIAVNLFIGIFTFGVGLIVTVPISVAFINILNMTLFYGKSNKRYYVDGTVFNPPTVEDGIK